MLSIGCHSVKYHSTKDYWSAANKTGDNKNAIMLFNNEWLNCVNYTRHMTRDDKKTDIIDLVCYTLSVDFPQGIKFICDEIGISYYHDFQEDLPESFKILDMLNSMSSNLECEKEIPLKPISKKILSYYHPYVNDLFYNDGIAYEVQKLFNIGYDDLTNRITIPVYSELGDLIGVKGRLLKQQIDSDEIKYLYLEPCNKSRILFGLNITMPYIKEQQKVFVFESEKAVMQMYSYGYQNAVATGGKTISKTQIDMLTRLGVQIIFCFDKDVQKNEIEDIANQFMDGIPIYYVYDENNILLDKESPSDNRDKWTGLLENNVYKIR